MGTDGMMLAEAPATEFEIIGLDSFSFGLDLQESLHCMVKMAV